MAVDRSKFKSSSVSQLTQSDKDLNKSMGRKERNNSNGHELDEGSNLLRIYPIHPDVAEADPKATFAVPFVQTFLPAIVDEKDKEGNIIKDAKGVAKTKLSVKPVFNAVVHAKGATKDLVDEYIKLATDWGKKNIPVESERKLFLEPVYGNFAKKINGITYPAKWVVYADKYPNANPDATPVFDKFFFKKSIKDRLNIISQMETKGDPLGTDPFTDIEEGRAISIFVNPDGGATGYYTTDLDSTTTKEVLGNGKTVKVPKAYPLSDDQLERFLAEKTLQEIFGNCAGRKNFEIQLAGLELFDSKNSMGIFELPEWEKIVVELDGFYPENGTEETKAAAKVEEVEEEEEEDNSDEFDYMNRQELQAYARSNKTGIVVKPSMSDLVIREQLRKWLAASGELVQEPLPTDDDYVDPSPEVKTTPVAKVVEEVEEKDDFLETMNAPVKKTFFEEEEEAATAATIAKKESAAERLAKLRNKNKAAA